MAYFYGISSENSRSFINSMLGTSGNIFGTTGVGSDNPLGDMALIKSGAYKKLLKAYYTEQEGDTTKKAETTNETKQKDKLAVSTEALSAANASSKELMDSLDSLGQYSLYRSTGTDENDNLVYDMDAIKSDVKKFVSAYNDYVTNNSKINNTAVSQKLVRAEKMTASNAKLLSKVGITVGDKQTLSFDESKLGQEDIATMKSLFTESGSYGFSLYDKSEESYKVTSSSSYANNNASSYSAKGNYSVLGSASSIMDQYL